MINGHGNDLHNYTNIKADFSSNVWFEGLKAELLNHLRKQVNCISNYPEPAASSFTKKTAQYYNLPENYCLATNGSAEAFYLIAQALNKNSATIIAPAFAEYADTCKQFNISIDYVTNSNLTKSRQFDSQLVWFANPNNPDGKVISINIVEEWLKAHPTTTFIIDEAYAELCTEFESAIGLIKNYKNLIITKSFTKAFAIPGLRLGIILSSESHITKIAQFQIPWSVNSLAITAGNYILENYSDLLIDKRILIEHSKKLQTDFECIPNIKVTASDCNYFLAETKFKTAAELKEYLANEHGLLIRDASNFKSLNSGHFRIALQTESMNKKLVEAIKQWMQ